MIRVRRPAPTQHLTATQLQELRTKQTQADGYSKSDPQITTTWKNFRETNTGKAVLAALQIVFRNKCAFCECVNAKSIDHYRPKERYPKKMFRWANFLLCCSNCNLAKGNRFPFRNRKPVLLDPTNDEPLDFCVWDLKSGAMASVTDPSLSRRAIYTRDQLKLDVYPLREARRVQCSRVLQYLTDVVNEDPVRPETRQRLEEELHPNREFLGIIRFLFRQPNVFRPIVDAARAKLPEIDTWVAEWL